MLPVGVAVGAKAGQVVLGKLSAQSKMIRVAVVAGGGFLLTRMKNDLAKGAGYGMIAAGTLEALSGNAIGTTLFSNPSGGVMGNDYKTPVGSI